MSGDRRIGQTLGRYRIDSKIGQGGFATVYRALDTVLERPVALKVLDAAALRDPTNSRRFLREGKAVAALDHPAIVPVYDAGDDDGTPWMAMRLVEGGSLDQVLAGGRRFESDEALALVRRIASALDHAHGQGLVHRDVKPSNILLEESNPHSAWLTDFGIAVTARTMGLYTTGALGTAAYMAPEQARPKQAGPPADLYSLACVAYELLTGTRPFPGDDHVALLMAHANDPVPPTGNAELDTFMARALAKSPEDRPRSGKELAGDLDQALGTARSDPSSAAAPPTIVPSGEAPTVAEARDHTLVQPPDRLPPALIGPPSGDPAPNSFPQMSAGYVRYEPYPSDPHIARANRNWGRRSLLAGGLILGLVGLVVAFLLTDRSAPTRRISDNAGVEYEIPRSWILEIDGTVTTLSEDQPRSEGGSTLATLRHEPASGRNALDALRATGNCAGDPTEMAPFPGTDTVARCTTPGDDALRTIVHAIAHDRLWIIAVYATAPEGDGDSFLSSLSFTAPATS